MSLKSVTFKAAMLAAFAFAGTASFAASAEAAAISKGDTIEISSIPRNLVRVVGTNLSTSPVVTALDFGNNGIGTGAEFSVDGGTGGFADYIGNLGTIKDITFVGGISGAIDDFLSINPDLFFDLTKATVVVGALESGGFRDVTVRFVGTFTNSFGSILGDGLLTTQLKLGGNGRDLPSSYSISAEAIPTPALIPGLLGLGAAALRKRKAEATKEPAEVA